LHISCSSKSQLFLPKCVATLRATRIDDHLPIRYLYGKSIQSPGCGGIFYIAMVIETGSVAGTKETILIRFPVNRTTKMSAAAIDSQEATL
jgi:hypothetical protein